MDFASNNKYERVDATRRHNVKEDNASSTPARPAHLLSSHSPKPKLAKESRRTTWYSGLRDEVCKFADSFHVTAADYSPTDEHPGGCKIPISTAPPQLLQVRAAHPPVAEPNGHNSDSDSSPVLLRKANKQRRKTASVYIGNHIFNKTNRRSKHLEAPSTMRNLPTSLAPHPQQTLVTVLENKKLRLAFQNFLESEYSAENLSFWLSCEKYKKLRTEEARVEEAHRIYNRFVVSTSPNQVNIDHVTQRQIATSMTFEDTPTDDVFDRAQTNIFAIMENDSFPRFLQSDRYKEAVARRNTFEVVLGNFLAGGRAPSPSGVGGGFPQVQSAHTSPAKCNHQHQERSLNSNNNNNTSSSSSNPDLRGVQLGGWARAVDGQLSRG